MKGFRGRHRVLENAIARFVAIIDMYLLLSNYRKIPSFQIIIYLISLDNFLLFSVYDFVCLLIYVPMDANAVCIFQNADSPQQCQE